MSGASDIPADILATASKYAHDLREWAAHGNTMTVYHDNDEHAFADTIARAIMAERDRCAEVADGLTKARTPGMPLFGAGMCNAADQIAIAIRAGSRP